MDGRVKIRVDMSWYNPTIIPTCNYINDSLLKEMRYTDFKLISIYTETNFHVV